MLSNINFYNFLLLLEQLHSIVTSYTLPQAGYRFIYPFVAVIGIFLAVPTNVFLLNTEGI